MHAAAPDGVQSKNPEGFFSNQYSLMRRLNPRSGSMTFHLGIKVSEKRKTGEYQSSPQRGLI
jgi:hypothetical protein